MRRKPLFICIMGIDGVGKTTHVNRLIGHLEKRKMPSRYVWSRFNHLLSLPLLGYCRLAGYTRIKTAEDGHRFFYPEFYRSEVVSRAYPWLLLIDVTLASVAKIYVPMLLGYNIVCDRFVYDTLVDLSVATGNRDLDKKLVGKLFLKLVPGNARFILLSLDKKTILERRPELRYDETFDQRYELYSTFSDSAYVLDNSRDIEDVQDLIINNVLMQPVGPEARQ